MKREDYDELAYLARCGMALRREKLARIDRSLRTALREGEELHSPIVTLLARSRVFNRERYRAAKSALESLWQHAIRLETT